jgi:uroporphyrinogen decarboxylase-like protein
MNGRERFDAIMEYGEFDRMPVWFFGTWKETKALWIEQGLAEFDIGARGAGPQLPGMDPDWESGMWRMHHLADSEPTPTGRPDKVLEETDDYIVIESGDGSIVKSGKRGSTIPNTLRHMLEPTRESWNEFKKRLDPDRASRRPEGWRESARELDRREHATCFLGGSLYSWPRGWLGMQNISLLMYDDPALFEDIVATVADFFMAVTGPVLDECRFEFAYFFEDCCFKNGPMFSPAIYRKHMHPHYRRMVDFYHSKGVKHVLIDSDGKVDALVPCWLESGIDIVFPIEVGTWKSDPVAFRKEYGKDLRMMGGVNKLVIAQGDAAIRAELEPLVDLAAEGGFIPLPDHRIPPNISLDAFRRYIDIFRELFGEGTMGPAPATTGLVPVEH